MNNNNDKQVPNLEKMDEREATRFLTELFSHLSAEAEYELRHEDYVVEMPQSGERFRGREKKREFRRPFYPAEDPPAPGAGEGRVVGRRGGQ